MRERPYSRFLYLFIAGVALIGLPLQVSYLYGHHLTQEWSQIWDKLTGTNVILMGLLIGLCVGLLRASFSKFLLPLTLAIMIFNNVIVGMDGADFTLLETFVASLSLGALSLWIISRRSYKAMTNRSLQWWRSDPRYELNVPVKLGLNELERQDFSTFDISRSGVFVKTNSEQGILNDPKLKLGGNFLLYFKDSKSPVNVEVVRHQISQSGKYMQGLGLKFVDLKTHQKALIQDLIRNQVGH
ncbi:MAG: PilZ domain-containing protein [Bacteriovoracaceae bacterium]